MCSCICSVSSNIYRSCSCISPFRMKSSLIFQRVKIQTEIKCITMNYSQIPTDAIHAKCYLKLNIFSIGNYWKNGLFVLGNPLIKADTRWYKYYTITIPWIIIIIIIIITTKHYSRYYRYFLFFIKLYLVNPHPNSRPKQCIKQHQNRTRAPFCKQKIDQPIPTLFFLSYNLLVEDIPDITTVTHLI